MKLLKKISLLIACFITLSMYIFTSILYAGLTESNLKENLDRERVMFDFSPTAPNEEFYYAFRNRDIAAMKIAVDKGADVNFALVLVADRKYYTDIEKLEIINMLLDKGANINAKNKDGRTALISVTLWNQTEIVKLLLDKEADINAKDNEGTALIYAIQYGKIDTAKLLLDKGADVNARALYGGTALTWAIRTDQVDMAKLLINKGADVNAKTLNRSTMDESTALMWAIQMDQYSIIKLLLDKGANVNAKNAIRKTALVLAYEEDQPKTIKLLQNKGAYISDQDKASAKIVAQHKKCMKIDSFCCFGMWGSAMGSGNH